MNLHASRPATRDRLLLALIGAVTLPYYIFLMTRGLDSLFMTTGAGMTFNSMLDHLLAGRFDVDPGTISREGFLHDGKVYAYFGVVPALLRLPLWPFLALRTVDVTGLMCVLAIWAGGLFQSASVLIIRRAAPLSATRSLGTMALLLSIALAGAQVPYLRPSIYQEVGSWAMTFAAMFIYWALRGFVDERGFTPALLVKMALAAGLALATRVTPGLGLYIAMSCLLLVLAARARLGNWRLLMPAVAVLAAFVLLVGAVNMMRWGKPWEFAPIHLQIMNQSFTDRTARLAEYGYFNLWRIPFGLGYYFFPIWAIVGADGQFLFSDFQDRMFDAIELPPSSFLLSDPLLILLFAALLRWRRDLGDRMGLAWALLCGFAVPPLLMLAGWYMAFRYRLEFQPLWVLGGLLGFHVLCGRAAAEPGRAILRGPILACCLIGIVVGQVTLPCYRATEFGPASMYLRHGRLGAGPFSFYASVLGF